LHQKCTIKINAGETKTHKYMTKLIETKISEIKDRGYHIFVTEFCLCLNWDSTEFQNKSLANLFSAIEMEGKTPNLNLIPYNSILSQKVKELPLDSAVYCMCSELISRSGKAMDDLIGKSVFQVVRKCYKSVNPTMRRSKRSTRLCDSAIISRRHRCGGL